VPEADKLDGYHAADFLLKAGGTMTGDLVLHGAPTADLEAASKKYVDDLIVSPGSLLKHVWSPLAPPASANAKDDEFEDSSFNAALWSEWDVDGNTTPGEDAAGAYLLKVTHADTSLSGVYQAQADADFTIWAHVGVSGLNANYGSAGLMLGADLAANPATSDLIFLNIEHRANTIGIQAQLFAQYNTYTSTYGNESNAQGVNACFLRIRQDATLLMFDFSLDGLSWNRLAASARPFTPKQVGLCVGNANTLQNVQARFQFFRALDTSVATEQLMSGRLIHLWG